jgi:hypothetical protein
VVDIASLETGGFQPIVDGSRPELDGTANIGVIGLGEGFEPFVLLERQGQMTSPDQDVLV